MWRPEECRHLFSLVAPWHGKTSFLWVLRSGTPEPSSVTPTLSFPQHFIISKHTAKLKEFYSYHMYTHHPGCTINILLYLFCHISIHLSITLSLDWFHTASRWTRIQTRSVPCQNLFPLHYTIFRVTSHPSLPRKGLGVVLGHRTCSFNISTAQGSFTL